jgi:formylmethanofuran dehydrogenase subunit B
MRVATQVTAPELAGPGAFVRGSAPVACLGCGCLCDDVTVNIEGSRVANFEPECLMGRRWFETAAAEDDGPEATVEGQPVASEVAVERAAELLREARRPVVYGLTATTTETVRDALALADRVRALVLLGRRVGDLDRVAAFQNLGRVGGTLGEVKNRADVVVFWGCDPVATHPRHGERYSIEATGRFLPRGRADRTVIVVDDRSSATATVADLAVPLPAGRDVDLAAALRWSCRDDSIDQARLAAACGLESGVLRTLVERLRGARYGAVFYQPRVEGCGIRAGWEALTALVRDLNGTSRFVLMATGAAGNLAGAEAALTWQAGFPQGVDFRRGHPSPVDDRVTLEEVLAAREADALLIVADPLPEGLSPAATGHLATIPTIVIAPGAWRREGVRPAVALAAATCGIDVTGSVTRSDGVALPLRPLRAPRFPSDRRWLGRIAEGIGEDEGGTCSLPRSGRTSA